MTAQTENEDRSRSSLVGVVVGIPLLLLLLYLFLAPAPIKLLFRALPSDVARRARPIRHVVFRPINGLRSQLPMYNQYLQWLDRQFGVVGTRTGTFTYEDAAYVKVTVPANGGLVLVTDPFLNLNDSPRTIGGIIGDQLTPGASAFTWNPAAQIFSETHPADVGRGKWKDDVVIPRGDVFWIRNAPNAPETNVYIVGQNPPTGNLGYPYGQAGQWTNTVLAQSLPSGSSMQQWDTDAQEFVSPEASKDSLGNWNPNPTMQAGEGFYLNAEPVSAWTDALMQSTEADEEVE